jgi:hypothetical protein
MIEIMETKAIKDLKEQFVFIPVFIGYFVLGILYPFLAMDIAKFVLFQISFILLPGYIFSDLFLKMHLSLVQKMFFGYPVSIVLIFLLSWIGKTFSIDYLEYVPIIISIIAVYKIFRDYESEHIQTENKKVSTLLIIIFYSICISITFITYIIPCAPPTTQYVGLYYQDSLWTVGNTWSYIRGFPIIDARFSEIPFSYHILQNIYHATIYKITGIDPFYLLFYICPIFDWLILIFCLIQGALKIAELSERMTIIFACVLLFASFPYTLGWHGHLYYVLISFFFGFPSFLMFIFILHAYFNQKKSLFVMYVAILYIIMAATKAILIIIVPVSLFIIFVIKYFKKSYAVKELVLGILIILGTLALYYTIYNDASTGTFEYYIVDKESKFYYYATKYFQLDSLYLLILHYLYVLFRRYLFYLPFCFVSIVVIFNKNFRNDIFSQYYFNCFFVSFMFVCSIMVSFFSIKGADGYFFWYTQVIQLLYFSSAVDYVWHDKKFSIIKLLSIFTIAFGIIYFINNVNNWTKSGWGSFSKNAETRIWDLRATIDVYEWQALQWAKKNLGIHKVFITDRRRFRHEGDNEEVGRFFAYSAISGMQAYAEGDDPLFIKQSLGTARRKWQTIDKFLLSSNIEEQDYTLNQIPADYFIQSLRFNNKSYSQLANLQLIYSNESIRIYKILKKHS